MRPRKEEEIIGLPRLTLFELVSEEYTAQVCQDIAIVQPLATFSLALSCGATALRGIWGYHGDHQPHGDRLLSLRRRVPVLTVVVDTPARIRHWFAIVDELTDETGLVTCEMVPAFRARHHRSDLRLSTLPAGEGA